MSIVLDSWKSGEGNVLVNLRLRKEIFRMIILLYWYYRVLLSEIETRDCLSEGKMVFQLGAIGTAEVMRTRDVIARHPSFRPKFNNLHERVSSRGIIISL